MELEGRELRERRHCGLRGRNRHRKPQSPLQVRTKAHAPFTSHPGSNAELACGSLCYGLRGDYIERAGSQGRRVFVRDLDMRAVAASTPPHLFQVAEAAEAPYMHMCGSAPGSPRVGGNTKSDVHRHRRLKQSHSSQALPAQDTTTDLACSAPWQHSDLPGTELSACVVIQMYKFTSRLHPPKKPKTRPMTQDRD